MHAIKEAYQKGKPALCYITSRPLYTPIFIGRDHWKFCFYHRIRLLINYQKASGNIRMSLLTATEKLWFPSFILFLQVVMLILFGVLVEYDDFGKPLEANAEPPASDAETPDDAITSYYPRALPHVYINMITLYRQR